MRTECSVDGRRPVGGKGLLRASLTLLCVLFASFAVSVPSALAFPAEFGSEGEGAGQFSNPQGVAVDQGSGDVYLVDRENNRVEKFGSEGQFLLGWGWGVADGVTAGAQTCAASCVAGIPGAGSGQFGERPEGVAVDNSLGFSRGDVYVADTNNSRVEKFEGDGKFVLMFGGEVNQTKDGMPLATEAEKDLCTAASGDVCKAGVAGAGQGAFERLGEHPVAVDSTGTVYVADRERVQRFGEGGVLEGQTLLPGIGTVNALAIDSAKDLYVTSFAFEGVREYDGSATELGKPRDATTSSVLPAVGPSDELFVDDLATRHILEYDASGNQLASVPDTRQSGGLAFGETIKMLYVAHQGAVRLLSMPPPGPFVLPGSETAGEIQPTSATVNATVNPEGAPAEYHFEYGTTAAYGESTATSAPLDAVDEVQSVTVAATGGAFTLAFRGEPTVEIPFNATAAELQAALEGITGLGVGQVAVSGESGGPWRVQFTGTRAGEDVPELTAEAGSLTGPEPAAVVATTTPGVSLFADREASAGLTGLQPGTAYHFRVVVTNAASQTSAGPDQTFETLPAVSIDSESVSQVTATSAKLSTELNAHGLATEYHFEYGRTTAYQEGPAPVPDAAAGSGTTDITPSPLLVQGLSPGVTYHYRVVAHNTLGTVTGPDRTFTTQGPQTRPLLDGRAWELVSPPDKHGVSLESLTSQGGLIQAAANGSGLAYIALAPTDTEPAGNRSIADTQLLAKRTGPGVWATQDITTPHEHVAGLNLGQLSEYQYFSSSLSFGFLQPAGSTPLSKLATERTPYRRDASGAYDPLVYPGDVPLGTEFRGKEEKPEVFSGGVTFITATPDGAHALLTSPTALTAGFSSNGNFESVYEWSAGTLQLVSILPNGVPAAEAGQGAGVGSSRNAVSADGARVVFKAQENWFVRDMALGETVQIDKPLPGARGGIGQPEFQLATSDGARVFFTDQARLTVGASATEGAPDLYMCQVAVVAGHLSCALKDVSVPVHAGEAAAVQGKVIGSDATGRYVYFAADGALAPGATSQDCTVGLCNLYVYDSLADSTRLVAVLSTRDKSDWNMSAAGPDLGALTGRVSDNGRYLAFMSEQPLTGFDNRDAVSGVRDQEVFLYDHETSELTCVSCAASGARPVGVFDRPGFPGLLVDRPGSSARATLAGSIPGWTRVGAASALYQSRYLSDSGRLFFNSPVGLVPGDGNGREDVYEYEPASAGGCEQPSGCVGLVSSGASGEESAFLDASATGPGGGEAEDVFFMTAARLSPADGDNAFDVYDAHVCSPAVPCPSGVVSVPPACTTADSCRAAPAPQPDLFGAPASSTFSGPGNLTPTPATPVKPLTRAQKLAKALKACKKQPSHRRAACRAQALRRYGPSKKHTSTKKSGRHN